MVRAELSKQLMVYIDNTVGKLAEVTSVISSSAINQVAICAYEVEGMVAIMFVTEDNNEAKRLLEKQGFEVQEEEVILLTVDNKPGALHRVTSKIAEAGVDLTLIYGSVTKDAPTSQIILISKNNLDVMMIIKTLLERS
jgi:hypothetical protein